MEANSDSAQRDALALVRTDLANERTLLAYGRTALMVAATGVTLVKFFPDQPNVNVTGWILVAAGTAIGGIGSFRFMRMRANLHPRPNKESGS